MAEIVVTGAGLAGLSTAMLLAKDGHRVTVLERDPAPPPSSAEESWDRWDRKGVNQFRLGHFFLARYRVILEEELPEVVAALDADGALRLNFISVLPDPVTGGWRDGDDAFECLSGRRPMFEAAMARVADDTDGLTVRRGTVAGSLLTNGSVRSGVPHVVGIRTEGGEEIRADLVVDTTGRRSPLPRWLAEAGGRAPYEELDDSGFVYFGRYFRSRDVGFPPFMGPVLQHFDSVSTVTLPADNATWSVVIAGHAKDAALRRLKDADRWAAAIRCYPTVAPWIEAEPLDEGVTTMAKIEDRWRRFVIDGEPVATGVVAVGDSWACSNPSVGRGATIGMMHVVGLRDLLRRQSLDDPWELALEWDRVTEETVAPWFHETMWGDRHRLAELEADIEGRPYAPEDPKYELLKAFGATSIMPDNLRRGIANGMMWKTLDEIFAEMGEETILSTGGFWRDMPKMGPSRADLLKVVNA